MAKMSDNTNSVQDNILYYRVADSMYFLPQLACSIVGGTKSVTFVYFNNL